MKNISGQPKVLKEINKSLILKCIKDKESITRAEIVEATHISHTTVRSILKELIDNEDVVVLGLDKSSGGRRAERYKINANKNCIMVGAIEDTQIYYRVVNLQGKILIENKAPLKSQKDFNPIFEIINNCLKAYKNINKIGLTVPGIITEKGYINGLGVNDWNEICLKKEIEAKCNIPCILENDLNAVALGYLNENPENSTMIYINFTSLGVGSGIIINGEIFKGYGGFAGELGVLPINDSYLNEIILGDCSDGLYIDTIVKTIKIITSLLNPKTIIIGGNTFRYNLYDKIIIQYKEQLDIKANIIIDNKQINYGLLGMSKTILKDI